MNSRKNTEEAAKHLRKLGWSVNRTDGGWNVCNPCWGEPNLYTDRELVNLGKAYKGGHTNACSQNVKKFDRRERSKVRDMIKTDKHDEFGFGNTNRIYKENIWNWD